MNRSPSSTSSRRVDLTGGAILPALLTLAWPVIVSNLMQTAYNLADTFWVGQLGEAAVAALSLGFPVIFLFISIGSGITIAGTALVAHNVGAQKEETANFLASQTVGFVAIVSLFLSVLGFFLCEPLIVVLGAEPEVLPHAVAYLRTWFVGIPAVFVFFVFQALVRGYGDTLNPMKVMLGSTAINIVLDPFLIFGWSVFPAMGVQGAAVATVTSRLLASAVGLYLLSSGRLGIKISAADLLPQKKTIGSLLQLGVPAAAEQSMKAIGITVMTGIVAAFGTSSLAAYGIGNRISSVIFLPSLGLAQATTAMVGQNLGAGHEDRAEKSVWLSSGIAFGLLSILGVGAYLWPEAIAGVFLPPGDVEAINLAANYIRIMSFSFGFLGVLNIKNGAFRGAGRTVTAMVFAVLSLLGMRVPIAYWLSMRTPLAESGLWWGVAIANVLGGIAVTFWFTRGKWKQRLVEDKPEKTGPQVEQTAPAPGVPKITGSDQGNCS